MKVGVLLYLCVSTFDPVICLPPPLHPPSSIFMVTPSTSLTYIFSAAIEYGPTCTADVAGLRRMLEVLADALD